MRDGKERQIGELGLFRGCGPADVKWIARVADAVDLPAGRVIEREGGASREFCVVVTGVASAADGEGEVLLSSGAYFGEMGLIDGRPHPRTIETRTPVRLLVFAPGAFRGMLQRIPSVGRRLLEDMAERPPSEHQEPRSLRAVS